MTTQPAINPAMFRGLDIRGKVGADLNPEAAALIARAFGTYARRHGQDRVVVGRDNRPSSPELEEAFVLGLVQSGCRVLRLGLAPTPVVYFHASQSGGCYGAIITASHLPVAFNGVKFCKGSLPFEPEELPALLQIVQSGNFSAGEGSLEDLPDALEAYSRHFLEHEPKVQPLPVVIDCQNGAASPVAPQLFERLGLQVHRLHASLEEGYPFEQPNPERTENLRQLREQVLETGAQVGIAYDGDADRMGVIDDQGEHISADRIVALFARDILQDRPGARVVYDVLCSQVLRDTILRSGGEPVEWKSGHAYIKSKLHQERAVLGGENSGHMFFADRYPGFDDGIYASYRLIELLSRARAPLSALNAELPVMHTTREKRPKCPPEMKEPVIGDLRRALEASGYPVLTMDGVKVFFEDGWGLVRASQTEPVLSIRFEARSEENLKKYQDLFLGLLKEAGEKHGVAFEL